MLSPSQDLFRRDIIGWRPCHLSSTHPRLPTTGRKLFQQAMMCVLPTRVLSTPANLILNVACSSNDADHVSQLLSNNAPLHCWIVESIRQPLMHFKDLSADKQWYYCTCSTSHNHYICTMHFIIRRRHNSNVNTTASAMIACDNSKHLTNRIMLRQITVNNAISWLPKQFCPIPFESHLSFPVAQDCE